MNPTIQNGWSSYCFIPTKLKSNDLNVSERPDWGGWGGRYGKVSHNLGLWASTADTVTGVDGRAHSSPQATIWRWRETFQNDFAARMIWTVSSEFGQVNHAPIALLNGARGTTPVNIRACPGDPVTLSADGSSDPDGQPLTYRWWWYREASGLFAPQVSLSSDAGTEVEVKIKDTVRTDQFTPPVSYDLHVILEIVDDGYPRLTSYRRAIINVPGAPGSVKGAQCAVVPFGPQHDDEP